MAVSGTGQGETPQSLVTPAFAGFSPIAESGTKAALTTGMTTDRKNFQSHKFCAIMVQNQISGYSAVGSALDLGSRGRAFESLYSDQMNEPLFSNIFIEKRGFSTWKALRYKGFLSLHLINAPAKIPKCQTIIERNSFFECFFRKTGFFFW